MEKKYTALLLVALIVGAEASALQQLTSPLLLQQGKWDGLGLSADVNEYIDNTLYMIVSFLQNHGLDPMPLPDIEEGFEVKPILITYSAWLRLHDGYMSGLMNLQRFDDQKIFYFAKMVRLRLAFEVIDLEFVYKYLVKVMNIGPTGGIVGTLDRLTVVADVIIDFNNDEVQLQEFSLNDIGRLRVRLTGNILIDWLINPVVGIFVRLFDTIIIRVVENTIRGALHDGIDIINSSVKVILDHLESI